MTGSGHNLRLDLIDERLWCDAEPVPVSNKAFQLLRLLVRNPNRLVTKEEILDCLWGEVHVTEGLVKEYIHDIRSALGDNATSPVFIETVHGRGYRYLGGITVVGSSPDAGRTEVGEPSIVVLPFRNLTPASETDYFSDGLTEEVTTALSLVPWLFVIARNTSFSFKGEQIAPALVGKELGVRYMLEGSVRTHAQRVRFIGRLIEVENNRLVWSKRFECAFGDIFEMQDQVTEAVVNSLAPSLQAAEIERARRQRPEKMSTYDQFLRATDRLNNGDIDGAKSLLDAAIRASPSYVKAKAVRAWCTTLVGWQFVPPAASDRDSALELSEEAFLNPDIDIEAAAYAAYTFGFFGVQVERAIAILEDITARSPSFAWAWASLALLTSYHVKASDRAIGFAKMALRLSPRDPQSFRCEMAICKSLLGTREYEKCMETAERGLSKSPNNAFLQMSRMTCLLHLGREHEAQAAANEFKRNNPEFTNSKWRELARNWHAWDDTIPLLVEAMRSLGIPD